MLKEPIRIVEDKKYPSMYRLQWKNGRKSENFYNRTRATDILKNYASYVENNKNKG